jgi:uncharacterized protein (DUF1015 family)
MNEIRPFVGWRFAREPKPRLAPPYDVISASERERYAAHPESIVHLTLPAARDGAPDYAGAGQLLGRWMEQGVLVRDARAGLYVVEERIGDGRIRRGFLALVRLADYAQRAVLPHERTMRGPIEDRLKLTREVRANLEPLFFLYEDRAGELDVFLRGPAQAKRAASEASVEWEELVRSESPDGTGLTLGSLCEPAALARVRAFLEARPLIIADGHHRYETMLHYRDECRAQGRSAPDAGHEFVMAYIVNAFDPGSRVQAIHRLLRGSVAPCEDVLRKHDFGLEELGSGLAPAALLERVARAAQTECAYLFVRPSGSALLARRPRDASLDIEVLHRDLLPALGGELSFDGSLERALATLREGGASLAILPAPIPPDTLFRVVQAGARLPQKSTYFAPKIPTGLVLRTLDA